MGFYIQDDMWEAVSELPRKSQDEVLGALARLFFDGEQTELKGVSKSLVIAFRERVLLSAKRSESGKQNGKQNREQNESKTASKTKAKSKSPIKEGEGDIEKDSPNGESKKTPPRHKHGRYGNVLLTDDDLAKLKAEFPADWQERIERLSEGIASKGYRYKNHLATIRSWARSDAEREARPRGGGEHERDEYSAL